MTRYNRHEKRSILMILILVLCAVILRLITVQGVVTDAPKMLLSLVRSGIYIGLIVAWGISLYRRVLHSAVRRYLLMIAALLLFWFLVRTSKYLLLEGLDAAQCYCWYAFYIPMLMIPMLGIFVAVCLGRPDDYVLPAAVKLLCIPTILLILVVLTNNFHKLVFFFPQAVLEPGGEYLYRPFYFVCVAWMGLEVLAFLLILLKQSHVPGKRKRIWIPVIPVGIAVLYSVGYILGFSPLYVIAGDMTAVFTLVMMATCEACIQTGLIPSNSHYDELFQASNIGAQIVDADYQRCFASNTARVLDPAVMREAEKGPVSLGSERLSSAPIRSGHVLWIEDLSRVQELLQKLEKTGQRLSENNNLLKAEVELREKQARTDEQMHIYDKITEEVAPQLQLLERLLEPEKDPEKLRENLVQACVISSYIKRRGNLILLGEEASFLPAQELEYCLQESMENLRLCRCAVSLACRCEGILVKDAAVAVYEFFESVIEAALPSLVAVLVNLTIQRECVQMSISLSCDPDAIRIDREFLESCGGSAIVSEQEGDVNVTFLLPGGGERK